MQTLPLSFTLQPRFLNTSSKSRQCIAQSQPQIRGIHDVNPMKTLPSQDISRAMFNKSQTSAYQLGTQLYTSADDIKELENACSAYLFRTDVGGQVKVYVGKNKMKKYVVYVEVSFLPELLNENKLVLNWGVYRSNSSTPSRISRTSLLRNPLGAHSVKMEFESNEAPFYLSFLLQCASSDFVAGNVEIRSHRKTIFCVPVGIGSGRPAPLGVSFSSDGGVNFALFSRNAEKVILCLYDEVGDESSLEIDMDPYINRTGDIWHVSMESVVAYKSYGYRCHGAIPQEKEITCNESHVLLDPYAKVLKRSFTDHPGSPVRYLGSLVKDPSFDWSGEVRPRLPMEKLVVYRLNVERYTKDKSSKLSSDVAGTFSGLIEKLQHFKELGVNAILLEPIFTFDEKKGPYFPNHFFSPMDLYGPTRDSLSATNSLKDMIKTMHANNIEVLLEVGFTCTADSGDYASQIVGLKGIDNKSYYVFNEGVDMKERSTLNCNYPVVQRMILDSLRYWVMEFHIDGFCFVNASSLLRGPHGEHLSRPPLIEAITFDPLLSNTKVIADSFDPYSLASNEAQFPHWKRWAEMNTRFCFDVRNFLRGEGLLSNLATRLCGSADVFLDGRGPAFSFNFIARNFGLPLVDLVSFSSSKLSSEFSWNCGVEGPTDITGVLEKRLKQIRNSLFILFISMGVPVLNMGDECGQSSGGSPSYSHRESFDWDALGTGFGVQITQFIAFLSALRTRRGDFLQRRNFMGVENLDWHGSDEAQPRWEDPSSRFLAMTLKADIDGTEPNSKPSFTSDLFIAFNASDSSETVILPSPSQEMAWFRLVDTALPFPGFFLTDGEPLIEHTPGSLAYEVKSHSCALFEAQLRVN